MLCFLADELDNFVDAGFQVVDRTVKQIGVAPVGKMRGLLVSDDDAA